ncbi:DBH-like monooxygenase protein 1 [Bulinus truncatus]|nr:DBH-like monooxygenase protein 1 [Bulinus truncatus]
MNFLIGSCTMILATVYCFTLLLPTTLSYPSYQDQIPNGQNVIHPCIPNYRWPGVGHQNRNGGGKRNNFGLDFYKAEHKWTEFLCRLDSDGDGRTNGEELGDPYCVWSPGTVPSRVENITHPGVCEPMNSSLCAAKVDFVSCQLEALDNCPVLNNTDVKFIDLRFTHFTLPASDTNYLCMTFDLPNDQDYHVIADQAIINNSNVLHHMVLYGYDDANTTVITQPTTCAMDIDAFTTVIAGWTVGYSGTCYGETVGFRFGKSGYTRVRLEIHYNNPKLISTYTDSSGLRLYYRPARPEVQDLFSLTSGQAFLELPPAQMRVEQIGVCKSSCTKALLKSPVYLIIALNHMHYFGRSMTVQLFRNGSLVANLTNDEYYSYDSPVVYVHFPPIQVLPGDEIVTTCVYNTMASKKWIYFGEGTTDEMCFGFLKFYPKTALSNLSGSCVSRSVLSSCELSQGTPVNGCDWKNLTDPNNPETIKMSTELSKNCNLDGFCRPECKQVINNITSSPCFQSEMSKFVKNALASSKEGLEILGRLQSCPVLPSQNCSGQCPNDCKGDNNGSSTIGVQSYLVVLMLIVLRHVLNCKGNYKDY